MGYTLGLRMARSTVFKTNRSQAVRLPKDVAFPETVREVEIVKVGSSRTISPVGKRWDDFFDEIPRASDDFMGDRHQPKLEDRERF
jgi:antitoxin VapB